jgi:hypothetical protein
MFQLTEKHAHMLVCLWTQAQFPTTLDQLSDKQDMPACPIGNWKQHKITGIKHNFAGAGKEMTHKNVSKEVIIYYVIRIHDSRMASKESSDYSFVRFLHIFPR